MASASPSGASASSPSSPPSGSSPSTSSLSATTSSSASPPARRRKAKVTTPYPFYLGGVAACMAAFATHPLELTKNLQQTAREKHSLASTLVYTARNEGVMALYQGLSASLLRQMTYSVTRFGAYDYLKERMRTPEDGPASKPLPAWKMALCASAAGAAGGLAGNPADILLVRMTSDLNKPPEKRYNYSNSLAGVYRMARDEGPMSLFRGLGPNLFRAVLMNASQLATYDLFKSSLLGTGHFKEGTPLHFTASFLAGTVATTVCAPADVIKARVMSASSSGQVLGKLKEALRKEGVSFLFRGWTPAWVRLSPNTILIFVTLEKLRLMVDKVREASGVQGKVEVKVT